MSAYLLGAHESVCLYACVVKTVLLPAWVAAPQWTHSPDSSQPRGQPGNMPVTGIRHSSQHTAVSTKCRNLHKSNKDSPSSHWRALPGPSCLSPWRIRAQGKCGRCLCVSAFQRATSSSGARSIDPWWAYSGHYTAAATRLLGSGEEPLSWPDPDGEEITFWVDFLPLTTGA